MSLIQDCANFQYAEEKCFCRDKEQDNHQPEESEEKEENRKTSIKWADWAGGQELQQVKLETPWPESIEEDKVEAALSNGHSVDETLPPLHVAQVKFEPSKSCIVGCVRDPDPEPEVVEEELPDTIEAHLELVKERESKQKMKEDIWEQDNPFRPEGELSKEADAIIGAIKEGRGAITPPPAHSPQIHSSSSSSQPELDTTHLDSPDEVVDRATAQEYLTSPRAGTMESAVVKVDRSMIVTSKTENVEHVVLPEKESTCCACVIL